MAILLFEKGKGEVITVPAHPAANWARAFQIHGPHGERRAGGDRHRAAPLRSGALAAPMEFIEPRAAIGPSLGADNIAKGLHSVAWGFARDHRVHVRVAYLLFGVISTLSLAVNLLLLIAVLSLIQDDADAAGHRGHRADAGHGHRRERAGQRAHPRGVARRQCATDGDLRRLRARLGHHPRFEHHDADRRLVAAGVRLGPGARFRHRALPGHPDVDMFFRGVLLARPGQPLVRPPEEAEVGADRPGVEAGRRDSTATACCSPTTPSSPRATADAAAAVAAKRPGAAR